VGNPREESCTRAAIALWLPSHAKKATYTIIRAALARCFCPQSNSTVRSRTPPFVARRFALAVRWPSSSVFARRLLVSNSVFARRSLVSGISFLCPLQPVPCNLIINPRCIDAFFWPFHFSFLF
jgi:hypothetical protein